MRIMSYDNHHTIMTASSMPLLLLLCMNLFQTRQAMRSICSCHCKESREDGTTYISKQARVLGSGFKSARSTRSSSLQQECGPFEHFALSTCAASLLRCLAIWSEIGIHVLSWQYRDSCMPHTKRTGWYCKHAAAGNEHVNAVTCHSLCRCNQL